MRRSIRLPAAVRNPVSLLGMAIATAMAVVFLILVLLDLLGFLGNPYIGLLVFVTVPAIFLVGLLLIPFGAWWRSRRPLAGPEAAEWPVIDLRDSRQRTVLVSVLILTLVNVVIVSMAAYGGVHYMESSEFCGQVCHTTMEPEFTAREVWPHAKVECVGCHVGPGAGSFVESKLAGTRQLFHLMTDRIPRPVPAPVRSLGDTGDTCEGCHWRGKSQGDTVRVIRESADDEKNSETLTTLTLHVGGPSGPGIHKHLSLDIEYVAADGKRSSIPYVRAGNSDGSAREFVVAGTTEEQIAAGPRRRMDCLDCHNRPAHTLVYTPQRAIDRAIGQRRIPRELPFVRREAVAAVMGEYADRAAGLQAIAKRLGEFYAGRGGVDALLVERAVTATQDEWARNVFPAMNVQWGTYPNYLGHVDTPGCFRCHDDEHKARDGRVISQDCELCHDVK